MTKSHVFLNLYRNLEEALKVKYNGQTLHYSSLVMEYMNTDGKKYFEVLDFCRELRNLLSHHSDIGGSAPVDPSDELISTLEKIIYEIEHPLTAQQMIIPTSRLVFATRDENVGELLDKMTEKGYSHIPVFRNDKLFGVLSIDAVFRFMKSNPGKTPESIKVSDMDEYLPTESHVYERYGFVSKNETAAKVKELFRASGPGSARMAAVFVTEDGTKNSKVVGMITPWDVIKKEN